MTTSRLVISAPTASVDGKYHCRYPRGDAPVGLLSAASNGRYLIAADGTPTLLMGDGAAQALVQRILTDVTAYLDDRQARGFNALWMHVIINDQDGGNVQGKTDDGIAPFTAVLSGSLSDASPNYDLTAPNPTYFQRLDDIINIAAARGMAVFLDTLENDSYMTVYRNNGDTRMTTFATYLVNRYKGFSNLVWMVGNDYQTWSTSPSDNQLGKDLISTFAANDSTHLRTIELDFNMSKSSDNSLLSPYVTLPSAYTYYPVYYEVGQQYAQNAGPVYLVESYYEGFFYGNLTPTGTTDLMLRKIAYWSTLAGALAGYFYGSIWYKFPPGWQSDIDTVAVAQVTIWKRFITSLPNWYLLVPDTSHAVVTAGYGTATGNVAGRIDTDNYVTTARTPDGKLVLAYLPVSTTVTVDMTQLSGGITARWFDPTTGTFTAIGGFANTGTHNFATPGTNSVGDSDWVLVLQAS